MIIKCNRIYFEDGVKSGYLFTEGKTIVDFKEEYDGTDYIDYSEHRLIPGIFDTHNHGTCGYNPDTKENVRGYLKALASQGVTNILPTVSDPEEIKAVAQVAKEGQIGATVLGIHSEGPWLNRVGEKGIKTGWPEVTMETAVAMVENSDGLLRLVDIAPEIEGLEEIVEYFHSKDVAIGFAHSDLDYEEASVAMKKYDITVATHLGNVMSGIHHRRMGGLGACLLNDNMQFEVICDGMHIGNPMLRLYFMMHDYSRYMMISDCTGLSGAPAGEYDVYGMKIIVHDNGFVLTDTGRLMGSSQPVLYGISNLVENVGIPLETVITMSSLNPAIKYGVDDHKGTIRIGKDADLLVINDDYKAVSTIANGIEVYNISEGKIFNPNFKF